MFDLKRKLQNENVLEYLVQTQGRFLKSSQIYARGTPHTEKAQHCHSKGSEKGMEKQAAIKALSLHDGLLTVRREASTRELPGD